MSNRPPIVRPQLLSLFLLLCLCSDVYASWILNGSAPENRSIRSKLAMEGRWVSIELPSVLSLTETAEQARTALRCLGWDVYVDDPAVGGDLATTVLMAFFPVHGQITLVIEPENSHVILWAFSRADEDGSRQNQDALHVFLRTYHQGGCGIS